MNASHPLIHLLVLATFLSAGCSQQISTEVTQPSQQVPRVSIEAKPMMAPLTQAELAAFMQIVSHLPNGKVPEFKPHTHPVTSKPHNVREHVGQLQQRFRQSINVEKQAAEWQRDPKLQRAFEKMGVQPIAFSSLAARISFAWSALAIGEKLPVETTQRQLASNLYRLMESVQSPPTNMSQHQYEQLLGALEETVALGEFLQLLKQVPVESVTQVTEFRNRLETLLPETTSVAAFERHLVNQPQIIRVGHSQ